MMLEGRHILVGVTGGIAAYKTASLIRLLVKEGAEVKVVMTPLAKEFITPLTLATLSRNPVLVDFFNPGNGDWNSHVDLGLWSDLYIIAPATANTMAKMASGVADNLLLTTYLSARCPVMLAPAMDLDMLKHPATLANMERLKSFGNILVEPDTGELASGLEGKGRMAEPEAILKVVLTTLSKKKKVDLSGLNILINAGPTYESIDPVRFIGNHSSGKMGVALASAAIRCGASVHLVTGPGVIIPPTMGCRITRVTSAAEMEAACSEAFPASDVAILAAAVADFTPEVHHNLKLKRGTEDLMIRLKPTADIARNLGSAKKENQIIIGFALETDNELENARGKLFRKNLDAIVLNSLRDTGAGFGTDTNLITIIDKYNNIDKFELKTKDEVAFDILEKIASLRQKTKR
jgi:phosphopantothenoylcysteine decarboxylase / phosphopantothenate---cysteine ligase